MMRAISTAVSVLLLALCVAAAEEKQPTEMRPYTQKVPGTAVSFDMVPIPGGTFMMGSPPLEKGRRDDEGPQFRVTVEPFYMGKCEVSWPEYEAFTINFSARYDVLPDIPADKLADAVTYPTPLYEQDFGPQLDARGGRGKGMPAVVMSQFAAKQYTEWLSKKTGRFYRLPSEAEWEYACRAGTTIAFSFGDDPARLGEYAWFAGNSPLKAGDDPSYHQAAQKKPNPWGLYDMHGNAGEWCIDQYDPNWYRQFDGKTVSWHDTINWPTKRYPCVIRGGGYQSAAEDCRSASRLESSKALNRMDPAMPKSAHWEADGFWIGFRVVSPVKEPPDEEKRRWWYDPDPMTAKTIQRDMQKHEIINPAKPAAGR